MIVVVLVCTGFPQVYRKKVIVYFGKKKKGQDRMKRIRSAIAARLVANVGAAKNGTPRKFLQSGYDGRIQIQGFFLSQGDHLFVFTCYLPYLKNYLKYLTLLQIGRI